MKILSIETSCDETALALIEANGDINSPDFSIIDTALISQIDIHKEYGGVFPALAKREHAKNLTPLLDNLINNFAEKERENKKEIDWQEIEVILEREPELFQSLKSLCEEKDFSNLNKEIDMIAVTSGPGLEPALWVGINFARAISKIFNIPLLPVNHMEGHIASVLLDKPKIEFPLLAILISGGHTELVLTKNWGDYEKIGQTLDDAIGEAYDKVARMLGLPYPGGPEISKLAEIAREENLESENIKLPRPMIGSGDLNFSLSGLKTAVLYKTEEIKKEFGEISEENKKIIAKEFEQAVVDVLIKKTKKAITDNFVETIIVGGGVIANQYIRDSLQKLADQESIPVFFPTKELSTDNAVMIGVAGYLKQFREEPKQEEDVDIVASGNLGLI